VPYWLQVYISQLKRERGALKAPAQKMKMALHR
jgi:hypothetical protein